MAETRDNGYVYDKLLKKKKIGISDGEDLLILAGFV